MKFILFAEGKTEKLFLPELFQRWLNPRLTKRVGVQAVRFEGWHNFCKQAPTKARYYFNSPKERDIIAIIGLLDLYGPTFYPGHTVTADDRYEWAAQKLMRDINQPRFHMFFSVHEVEAWLLAHPDIFPAEISRALPGKIKEPESVNFDEPPAKLLDRIYQQRRKTKYLKVTDGANLFHQLDPEIVGQKCPRFNAMLEKMLELAQAAGN